MGNQKNNITLLPERGGVAIETAHTPETGGNKDQGKKKQTRRTGGGGKALFIRRLGLGDKPNDRQMAILVGLTGLER